MRTPVAAVLAATLLLACTGVPVGPAGSQAPGTASGGTGGTGGTGGAVGTSPPPGRRTGAVLVAAGDIADCASAGDEATAELVARIMGRVATLGDNVYAAGTPAQFSRCYGAAWGPFKRRTSPSLGNHDYGTAGAAGYFGYFGRRAGPAGRGWYSYDLGSWHVVVLNSNCSQVGGCFRGSPQERWLRADLAASRSRCTLAYWHHPRFSSGTTHGGDLVAGAFWKSLYAAGAEVVLNGHEHNYERFAPQDPSGAADPERGIRQFVVGTGGKTLYGLGAPAPNSQVRYSDSFGVLKLQLASDAYTWEFIPVEGATFSDTGTGTCH